MKEIPSKPISVCVPRLFIVFEILFREYILCPHTHTYTQKLNGGIPKKKVSLLLPEYITMPIIDCISTIIEPEAICVLMNEWMDGCYSNEINGRNVSIFFLFAASPFNELY